VPPAAVNRLLYRACLIEERIGRVVPFPFGSSLIIHAAAADPAR
jgi:hypothetical protein